MDEVRHLMNKFIRRLEEEERDLADSKQWELGELKRCMELETLRAKEAVREEMRAAHT